jgi:hypothetical protein
MLIKVLLEFSVQLVHSAANKILPEVIAVPAARRNASSKGATSRGFNAAAPTLAG